MSEQLPFKAYVLMPSFKIKEVEVLRNCGRWSPDYYQISGSTKYYHMTDLFSSHEVALRAGNEKIKMAEANLLKRRETIDKKKANLAKEQK